MCVNRFLGILFSNVPTSIVSKVCIFFSVPVLFLRHLSSLCGLFLVHLFLCGVKYFLIYFMDTIARLSSTNRTMHKTVQQLTYFVCVVRAIQFSLNKKRVIPYLALKLADGKHFFQAIKYGLCTVLYYRFVHFIVFCYLFIKIFNEITRKDS